MCMKSGQAADGRRRSKDPLDRSDPYNLEAFAVRQFGKPGGKRLNMPGSGPLPSATNRNSGKPDRITYDDELSRAAGEPTLARAPAYTLPSQQRSLMSRRVRR